MHKCEFPNGMVIKPDGVNELDPCIYEVVEKYANVTIEVLKCKTVGTPRFHGIGKKIQKS